jgi:hypothetical protein
MQIKVFGLDLSTDNTLWDINANYRIDVLAIYLIATLIADINIMNA